MNAKNIIRIILGIAALVLGYFLFESIMKPQRFETLRSRKEAEIVNRLKDIRTAQIAFRNVHGRFTGSFDTLVMFLEHGKMPTVRRTGEIPEEMTESEALRLGIIRRDTIFSDAYAVLFPNHDKETHLAGLRFIPFSGRTIEFTIDAGFIERGGAHAGATISVPVIEVSAHLKDYMTEPEYKQLVVNAIQRAKDMNRFPGRRFGSMLEPITEGNWE